MLEGLDQVDWGSLGKLVSGLAATKVPELIRSLLSDEKGVRDGALDHLFGSQQDFGTITYATPYIIPLIIELIADENTLDRVTLLQCFLAHFDYLQRIAFSPSDVRKMQLYAKVYEAIEGGVRVYLELLKSPAIQIQEVTIQLLGKLHRSVRI